ncbi:MAG: Mut7-C ubiquitin/RNAse domain-containing protein [Desulfobacterales bacterium]|nr:Mut7-C ubiquitin/RNAse domain-containing protein [Desulfobacterales bacterium]
MMEIQLLLHGDLNLLLRQRRLRAEKRLCLPLRRRTSIKDLLESLGIPHAEISRLEVNGREVSFAHIVEPGDRIAARPLTPPVDFSVATKLRPEPLGATRFLVDVNVGKLAPWLRMAGFDTGYHPGLADRDLAGLAVREERILLTRDSGLLKHKIVVFGHLIRARQPDEQLREVVQLFGLGSRIRPFSRCMRCNGQLQPVAREEVFDRLEPLTRKYYHTFTRCEECDRIYWPGSHRARMATLLNELTGPEGVSLDYAK